MSRQSLQFLLNPQDSAIGLFPPTIVTYSLNSEEVDYNYLLKLKINDTILKPFCKFYKLDARALVFTALNYDYIPVTLNANTILENIANTEQLNVHQLIIKVNFLDTLEFDANGRIVDLSSTEQQQDHPENCPYLQFSLKLSNENNDHEEEFDKKKVEKKSLVLDEKSNIIDFSGSEHKQNFWPTIKLRLREFNLHQEYQITIAKLVCAYCAYVLLSTQHNSDTIKSFENILEYFSKFKYLILASQREALVVLNNEFTDIEPKLTFESSIPSPAPSESYDSHNELVNSIEKLSNSSSFKSNPQLHKTFRDVKISQNAILNIYTVDNYSDFISQNFSKVNEKGNANANANAEQEILSANSTRDPYKKSSNSNATSETTRTSQVSAETGVSKEKLEKQGSQVQYEEVYVLETKETLKEQSEENKKEKENEENEESSHDAEKGAGNEFKESKVFDTTTALPFSVFKNVAMDFADFTKKPTQVEDVENDSKSLDESEKKESNASDNLKLPEERADVHNSKDTDKVQDLQGKTGKLLTEFLNQGIPENNAEDVTDNELKKDQQNERINQREDKESQENSERESKKDNFLLTRFLNASEPTALDLNRNEPHSIDTKGDNLTDVQAVNIRSDQDAQPLKPEEHVIDISTPAPPPVPYSDKGFNGRQEETLIEDGDKSAQKKSTPTSNPNGFVDSYAYESDDVELVSYTKPVRDSNVTQKPAVTIKKEPLTTSKAVPNSSKEATKKQRQHIASPRSSKNNTYAQSGGSVPDIFDIESSDSDVSFQENYHKRDLSSHKFDVNGYTNALPNGKKADQQHGDSDVQIEDSNFQMAESNQDALQGYYKDPEHSTVLTNKETDQNNEENSDIHLEKGQLEENQPKQESIVSSKEEESEKEFARQLVKNKFGNDSNIQIKENQFKHITTVPSKKKQHEKRSLEHLDINKSGNVSDVQLEESQPEREHNVQPGEDQLEKELSVSLAKDDSAKESIVQLEQAELPKKSNRHLMEKNTENQTIKLDDKFDAHSDEKPNEESDIEVVEKEEESQNEIRNYRRESNKKSLFKSDQNLKPLIKKAEKSLRRKHVASGGSETKKGIRQTRSLLRQSTISKVDRPSAKSDDFYSDANGSDFEVISNDNDEINSLASTDNDDQSKSKKQQKQYVANATTKRSVQSRKKPYEKPKPKLFEKSETQVEGSSKFNEIETHLKSGLTKEREDAQKNTLSGKAEKEIWSTRKHLRESSKTKPQTRVSYSRREKPHHRRKEFAEAESSKSDPEVITDLVSLSSSGSEFAIESNSDSEAKPEVQNTSSSNSASDIEFVQKPVKRQRISKLREKKISSDLPKQEKRFLPKKSISKKVPSYKSQEFKRGTKSSKDLGSTRKRLRDRPLKDYSVKNLFSELLPKKHRSNNSKTSDSDIEFEGQHTVSEDNAVEMEEVHSFSENNSENESSDFEMLSKSLRSKKLHSNSRHSFTGTYKRNPRKAGAYKKREYERKSHRALRVPAAKLSISERSKPSEKLLLDALTSSDEGSDDASIEFEPVRSRSSARSRLKSKPVSKLEKKPKSVVKLDKKVKPTKKLDKKFARQDIVSSDSSSDVFSVVASQESFKEKRHKESTSEKSKKDKDLEQKRKDSSDEFEVLDEFVNDSEVVERKNDSYRKNRLRNNDATRKNITSSLALLDQPLSKGNSHKKEEKSLIQNILHRKNLSFKDKIKEIFKNQASDEEDLDDEMLSFIAED